MNAPAASFLTRLSLDSASDQLQQWLARRWVVWTVNALAVALLTYSLAQWTWRLAAPKPSAGPAPAVAPQAASRAQDLQTILAANLFGTGGVAARQLPLNAIPLTSLNLVLTGVVVTTTGSFALMSINGAPEEPRAVGQAITAGATLQAVYADRAILVRNGAQEAVLLKDSQSTAGSGVTLPTANLPSGPIVSQIGTNQFDVDRNQLQKQMHSAEFLSQALIVPSAGGGFLVREIKPGSLYERMGLRVGDIIRTVNGQNINNIEDVMRIYQQMGSDQPTANVDIDVTRAGQPQRLQYSLH